MTDYYVSQLRGSNSNAGTSTAAPFKTLAKITGTNGLQKPGNRFFLERGSVFAERVIVDEKHQGSPASPIFWDAYGDPSLPWPKIVHPLSGTGRTDMLRIEAPCGTNAGGDPDINAVVGISYATASSGTLTITTRTAHGLTTTLVAGTNAPWVELMFAIPARFNFIAQIASVPTTTTFTITGVNSLVASDGSTLVGSGLSVGAQTLTRAARLTTPKWVAIRNIEVENDPVAMAAAGYCVAARGAAGVDTGTVYVRTGSLYAINVTAGADRFTIENFRAAGAETGLNVSGQTAHVIADGLCELNGMLQEWGPAGDSEPTVASWSYSAGTLTVNTTAAHGLATGDFVSLWKDGTVAYVDRQAMTKVDNDTFTVAAIPYGATSASDPGSLSGTVRVYATAANDTDDQLGGWGATVRGINPRMNLTCMNNMSGMLRPTDPGVKAGGLTSSSGSNKKMSNGCELYTIVNTATDPDDGTLIRIRTNDRVASEVGSANAAVTAISSASNATGGYILSVTASGHPFKIGQLITLTGTSIDGEYLCVDTASGAFYLYTATNPGTIADQSGLATTLSTGTIYADLVHITPHIQAHLLTTRGVGQQAAGEFGPVTGTQVRRAISVCSATDSGTSCISASADHAPGDTEITDSLLVSGYDAVASDIATITDLLVSGNLVYGRRKNWASGTVPAGQQLDPGDGEALLAAASDFDRCEALVRRVLAARR